MSKDSRLDELTPYGFTWRQAIEAISYESYRAKRHVEIKQELDRELYGDKQCSNPCCSTVSHAKFCKSCRTKLTDLQKARRQQRIEMWQREAGNTPCKVCGQPRGYPATGGFFCSQTCWDSHRSERHQVRARSSRDLPGYVYELHSPDSGVVYVGKTNYPERRFAQHAATKWWADQISSAVVYAFGTESEALDYEAWAIREHDPMHNVVRPSIPEIIPTPIRTYTVADPLPVAA